jgi:hypothetical protein
MRAAPILCALAACTTLPEPRDVLAFVTPDEVSASRTFGDFTSPDWGDSYIADETYLLTLTWYVSPREVRVLDEAEVPRAYWEPDREPPALATGTTDGISIKVDAEGNRSVIIPTALIIALVTALGLAAEAARRKYMGGKTLKPEVDTQA